MLLGLPVQAGDHGVGGEYAASRAGDDNLACSKTSYSEEKLNDLEPVIMSLVISRGAVKVLGSWLSCPL